MLRENREHACSIIGNLAFRRGYGKQHGIGTDLHLLLRRVGNQLLRLGKEQRGLYLAGINAKLLEGHHEAYLMIGHAECNCGSYRHGQPARQLRHFHGVIAPLGLIARRQGQRQIARLGNADVLANEPARLERQY